MRPTAYLIQMPSWPLHSALPFIMRVLVAIGALYMVLEPTIWRGFVQASPPSAAAVQTARTLPSAHRLLEIAAYSFQGIPVPQGEQALRMATRLLNGKDFMEGSSGQPNALPFTAKAAAADFLLHSSATAPARAPVVYELPFAEHDLLRADGIGGLPYASLYLTNVLLAAHTANGDVRYLAAARDSILAFARWESAQWRSLGFVWNDHAVATRAGVLLRFWHAWRGHPLYRADEAREILGYVARIGTLMASTRDFNVRTNHGVMQNLGLLQLSLGFPQLEQADTWQATSLLRLRAQVPFLYAEDGFVLEHSAHYHELGVQLLAMAVRLTEMAKEPVPDLWRQRLAAASRRLIDITRPDGTLPAYGDTEVELWPAGGPTPPAASRVLATRFATYPLSGYAVWSFAAPQASHTVSVWSRFPGHGHKLADELSLLIWGAGRGWITNTGYWGYTGWGRPFTEAWTGSNAPHELGESGQAARDTQLSGSAHDAESVYIDLLRKHATGARYRREILNLSAGLWLVVDSNSDLKKLQVETLWTFMPDLQLDAQAQLEYHLRDDVGTTMSVAVRAGQSPQLQVLRGERQPFAGWVAVGQAGVPAPTLRVLSAPGERTAILFSLNPLATKQFSLSPTADGGWRASGLGWFAQRDADAVRWRHGGDEHKLVPTESPDTQAARQQLRSSFDQATRIYQRDINIDTYRVRVAWLLLGALLLQELGLYRHRAASRTSRGGSARWPLNAGLVFMWLCATTWLQLVYFRAH